MGKLWSCAIIAVVLVIIAGCNYDPILPSGPQEVGETILLLSLRAPNRNWHELTFVEMPEGVLEIRHQLTREPTGKRVELSLGESYDVPFYTRRNIKKVISNDLVLREVNVMMPIYSFILPKNQNEVYGIGLAPFFYNEVILIIKVGERPGK